VGTNVLAYYTHLSEVVKQFPAQYRIFKVEKRFFLAGFLYVPFFFVLRAIAVKITLSTPSLAARIGPAIMCSGRHTPGRRQPAGRAPVV
jgi:hypothetical protein